jgi:hypothetical protein
VVISELNTWPVCTPVNASPASLRTQAHDSEPKWCATPFLCGSLIRYSMPVYPGASLMTLLGERSKEKKLFYYRPDDLIPANHVLRLIDQCVDFASSVPG